MMQQPVALFLVSIEQTLRRNLVAAFAGTVASNATSALDATKRPTHAMEERVFFIGVPSWFFCDHYATVA